MKMTGRRSENQQLWKRDIRDRIGNENGASLVVAILFFVLCGVGASVILAAASATAGKMKKVPEADQKRFAVESAAGFLRDELKDSKTKVTITDVKVDDERASGENPTYSLAYSWGDNTTTGTDSILGACVDQTYVSLEEEDDSSKSGQETKADQASQTENTASDEFHLSIKTTKGTSETDLSQLQTAVSFSMDSGYNIKAVIKDTQTQKEHEEDRCERLLTVPAKSDMDETVDVEEFEETDDEGNVTDEWTVTTTTRVTTIYWERGTIERTHPAAK